VTRRFVIATDPLTSDEEKELQKFFKGHGWWKWLPNFWLAVDLTDTLTTVAIRDRIHEINKSKRAWVLQVEPISWASLTREDSQGRDGTDWIKRNWQAD
jgi:hypothetical protein